MRGHDPGRYVLIGQTPVPEPDLMTWARWFETADRTVKRERIGSADGEITVSTVFLGLDHRFTSNGPPILFETMVFDASRKEVDCARCATWPEAERQHERIAGPLRRKAAHADCP